ncbi:MAG: hypothetical protein HEEMFOPI_00638 [Holosporales bacterium]
MVNMTLYLNSIFLERIKVKIKFKFFLIGCINMAYAYSASAPLVPAGVSGTLVPAGTCLDSSIEPPSFEELMNINPLIEKNKEDHHLQRGDRLQVGRYAISLDRINLAKDSVIFYFYYDNKSIIHSKLENTGVLIASYVNNQFMLLINLHLVDVNHLSNILKIFKRLFFYHPLRFYLPIDEQDRIAIAYNNGGVLFKRDPSSEEIILPCYAPIKHLDVPLYGHYLKILESMSISGNLKPIFDHIKTSIVLNKIDELKVDQWLFLTRHMFANVQEKIKSEVPGSRLLYSVLTHQTLYLLEMKGLIPGLNLAEGGIVTFYRDGYSTVSPSGKITTHKPQQVSCYVKGGWAALPKSREEGDVFVRGPDCVIDIGDRMEPNKYAYKTFITNEGEKHVVISDNGIEEGNFLVVRKEKDETVMYHLGGINAQQPFSVLQKQQLDKTMPCDEVIIPLPTDDTDLKVLESLLLEIEREEKEKEMQEKIQAIQNAKVEEVPDAALTEEQKIDFLKEQEKIRN